MILPDGFQLTWGAEKDRRPTTLSWELPIGNQVRKGTVRWDHRPTEEHLREAVAGALGLVSGWETGQTAVCHRVVWFGRAFYLYHLTGPPTWWIPRFSLKPKEQVLLVGWLQQAFGISYEGRARW